MGDEIHEMRGKEDALYIYSYLSILFITTSVYICIWVLLLKVG